MTAAAPAPAERWSLARSSSRPSAASAGRASFTHVHDWTMRHSPAGTPDWFGWANAVIIELIPVAAFLAIRRRRRAGAPIGYPSSCSSPPSRCRWPRSWPSPSPAVGVAAVGAVPALAFLALVKLVLDHPGSAWPLEPARPHPRRSRPHSERRHAPVAARPGLERRPAGARPAAGCVPVPADAFTRLNGTPAIGSVTR